MAASGVAVKLPGLQGGAGQDSYSNNSRLQNYLFHEYCKPDFLHALQSVISTFVINDDGADEAPATSNGGGGLHDADGRRAAAQSEGRPLQLRIADLGCSHGPNTLQHAQLTVQAILRAAFGKAAAQEKAISSRSLPHVEVQYFFSDLPGNDFNSLFRSLQPVGPQLQSFVVADELGRAVAQQEKLRVFAAGVPGSFYARVFPENTLHFAICSFSLHWLSQVPPDVMDRNSKFWNGGHVWIDGSRPEICEAYARQFQNDAKAFFKCRVKELVKGGILYICGSSRYDLRPTSFYMQHTDLWMCEFDSCWQDMVDEGLISEEERDTFNVPFYNCHQDELMEVLEGALKDDMEVVKIETVKECEKMPLQRYQKLISDAEAFGKLRANLLASLAKPLVQAHIGDERTEELFKRVQEKLIAGSRSLPQSGHPTNRATTIIATLRKL